MAQTFQRLVLATECTEFDAGAERLALAMARRCARPLAVIMPLISNPEYEASAPQWAERDERDAAAKLARLREQARHAGVEIELRVRRGGEPFREIVDDAQERGAELIIIRRRGQRSVLAELLIGEMVSQVVAHAPCSVLVVPPNADLWAVRVLVAAEPGPQGQQLLAMASSVALADALPLTVVCVAASDSPAQRRPAEAFVTQAQHGARQAGVAANGQVRVGEPAAQILDAAKHDATDLIVIGVRGNTGIGPARLGGVAQQVAGLSDCAVLLVQQGVSNKGFST